MGGIMSNQHHDIHRAWLYRIRSWCDATNGNQQRLATALGVDRRRVSGWLNRTAPACPAWAVSPIERYTGVTHHVDHLRPLSPA